jgi:hypothetical protein
VRDPNPEGEEHPYPGLPLTNAAAALVGLTDRCILSLSFPRRAGRSWLWF